ncbi:MAG: MFS transporter [Deltaproteobacteria bacterium]|nr:MFS transporter [Deltaproteobacteria bacterium]
MGHRRFEHRVHYGWVIVLTGAMALFSCLGLARFAFGMILPSMGKALQLGYDQMGYIGTANFVGYLLSVALAPRFLRRPGARRTIAGALALIGACLILIGRSTTFATVLGLYFLTGLGTGLVNVPMMVLAGQWVSRTLRGRAIGCMATGNGVGIIFSGFVVPAFNRGLGAEGWRTAWIVLGVLSLAISCVAALLLRDSPSEMGLEPLGAGPPVPPAGVGATPEPVDAVRIVVRLGVLYFLFGATYMIYGTFVVTSMVREYGLAEATAGRFWAWVGFFSLFSGPLFGALSDRIGRKWAIAAVFVVQTAAYALAGARLGVPALYGSVVLYGLAAWAIPTIMGAAVVDYLGPMRAAGAFSAITFFFAAGQTVGPAVAGWAAKASQSFSLSFVFAALLTTIGAVLAATLRPPHSADSAPARVPAA